MNTLGREAMLIDIIQHFPFLYDKERKEFKDNNIKENAWDTIATAMATPGKIFYIF